MSFGGSLSSLCMDLEVARVLEPFLEAVEAGRQPDPARLLAENPQLAGRLRVCLDALQIELDGQFSQDAVLGSLCAQPVSLSLPDERMDPSAVFGCAQRRRSFGDYELLNEIARGGMGIVYRARQRRLNRLVAVKLINASGWSSGHHQRRFRAEVEAMALLDHPQIVPIYEAGEFEGIPYFSMRLLDGGSLADQLHRYPADPRAAATLCVQLAHAVHYAHQQGILHRDLKPSNILLDTEGRPYIADFGLAKRFGASGDLTLSGMVVGTPVYMAPEQAEGNRVELSAASDVYSLGAILYAMLTGKPPVAGDRLTEILLQLRLQPPIPPRTLNRRVDRALEAICLKSLEKDPARRYSTTEALADDLNRYLAGQSVHARYQGWSQRLSLQVRSPQQIGRAGQFALMLGLAMLARALSEFVLLGVGLIEVDRPWLFTGQVALGLVGIILPLIVVGWSTLQNRGWSLWGGTFLSLGILLIVLGHLLGVLTLGVGSLADEPRPAMRVEADAFPLVLSLTLHSSYLLALFAWSSARKSRPSVSAENP